MPGSVHRQMLVDFAYLCYFFQVTVHHLITRNWKQDALLCGFLVSLIFLYDGKRDIKQRNVAHLFCLLTRLAYSLVAIVVGDNMLVGQLRHISEGKSGESRHQEHILDDFEAFASGVAIIYAVNFFQSEKLRLGRLLPKFYPDKRVFLNLVVGEATVGYLFQCFHIADESILTEVFLRL